MEWTWRDRVRDPRFAGLAGLALGVGCGLLILQRRHLAAAATGAGVAVLAAVLVGAAALPPWRDPRHPASVGGLILGGFGLLVFLACLAIGFGAGVS